MTAMPQYQTASCRAAGLPHHKSVRLIHGARLDFESQPPGWQSWPEKNRPLLRLDAPARAGT
jgi:hypothetical protein